MNVCDPSRININLNQQHMNEEQGGTALVDKENHSADINTQITDDMVVGGSKRSRTLDSEQSAKFWENEYKKLKQLRESGAEILMEAMKEEYRERENCLLEKIKILEEENYKEDHKCDKEKEVADIVNGKEDEMRALRQINNFYEVFTSSKVTLAEDGSFICIITGDNDSTSTLKLQFQKDKTEMRAEPVQGDFSNLPEYLRDGAIDFDVSQCPHLLKDTFLKVLKGDEEE